MTIREVREGDIEAVIELFRKNYGDEYSVPEFYYANPAGSDFHILSQTNRDLASLHR